MTTTNKHISRHVRPIGLPVRKVYRLQLNVKKNSLNIIGQSIINQSISQPVCLPVYMSVYLSISNIHTLSLLHMHLTQEYTRQSVRNCYNFATLASPICNWRCSCLQKQTPDTSPKYLHTSRLIATDISNNVFQTRSLMRTNDSSNCTSQPLVYVWLLIEIYCFWLTVCHCAVYKLQVLQSVAQIYACSGPYRTIGTSL